MVPHIAKNASMRYTIGTDECGVGCAAGPLVAAAVVLPHGANLDGLTDSKKLTPKKRERLAWLVIEQAPYWEYGFVSAARVDQQGIHKARLMLMRRLVERVREELGEELPAIVDGDEGVGLPNCESIVKADQSIPAVSAASIIAKVLRDRYMVMIGEKYPEYEFAQHKGYVTALHKERLMKYGPCIEHRRSFRPVQEAIRQCIWGG